MDRFSAQGSFRPTRRKTKEGYLLADVVLSRTGVQHLLQPNQSVLMTQQALAAAGTMESALNKPVTLGHPPEFLNAKNIRDYAVGYLTGDVEYENGLLKGHVMITDSQAIGAIESGIDQVSIGFEADGKSVKGTHNGENYETQLDGPLHINHLAIVTKGAARPEARVLASAQEPSTNQQETNMPDEDKKTPVDESLSTEEVRELARTEAEEMIKAVAAAGEKQAQEDEEKRKAVERRVRLIVQASAYIPEAEERAALHDLSDRDIAIKVLTAENAQFQAEGKSDEFLFGQLAHSHSLREQAKDQRSDMLSRANTAPEPKQHTAGSGDKPQIDFTDFGTIESIINNTKG